ncbi:uncharacterized protein Pyn_28863 [Prunus yedoensis var. nudiflora]|uniref:Uncharacterized protein n=1 Tax=Prunus yedoensis var. nudiflora TaxID=2094558 RepID=A0A314Z9S0_PRUYE|nr:uncharacterized protein Pyn_28863 [Prunus yedoensis var. nudiflora]
MLRLKDGGKGCIPVICNPLTVISELPAAAALSLPGMASLPHGNPTSCSLVCERGPISFVGISALPSIQLRARAFDGLVRGRVITHSLYRKETSLFCEKGSNSINRIMTIPRSSSSDSNGTEDDSSDQAKKKPFGYSRKDVLLIGLGFAGVDPLQAGNVVQLVLVLGLTIGWISTYIFRVSNKEMTYAQQIRDYENKVMEKRLEGLTEAELEALLEQVEEEKRRLGEQVK